MNNNNNNDHDPIGDLLRRLTGTPEPTAKEREQAERALTAAIDAEHRLPVTGRRKWGRQPIIWVTVLAVVLTFGSLILPDRASATLGEIAVAAERTEPFNIPAQSFAYTRSETQELSIMPADAFGRVVAPAERVAYLVPQTREAWISNQGVLQLRVTTGQPIFFSKEAETAYYGAGLDRLDQVGETITESFTGVGLLAQTWPTTPVELAQTIRDRFPPDRGLPDEVEILDISLDLLRETAAPPELRAAVLRVIADLNLELLERLPDGPATFAIDYHSPLPTRDMFTINSTGQLLAESSTLTNGNPDLALPPGTATFQARYQPVEIVTGLGVSE